MPRSCTQTDTQARTHERKHIHTCVSLPSLLPPLTILPLTSLLPCLLCAHLELACGLPPKYTITSTIPFAGNAAQYAQLTCSFCLPSNFRSAGSTWSRTASAPLLARRPKSLGTSPSSGTATARATLTVNWRPTWR